VRAGRRRACSSPRLEPLLQAAQLLVLARQVGERLVEHLLEAGALGVQSLLEAGGLGSQLGLATRQRLELGLELRALGAQRRHLLGDLCLDAVVHLARQSRELGLDLRGPLGCDLACRERSAEALVSSRERRRS